VATIKKCWVDRYIALGEQRITKRVFLRVKVLKRAEDGEICQNIHILNKLKSKISRRHINCSN
jgi:hypothetical protein